MWRAIFEGLKKALRGAFGVGLFIFTLPFRLFAPRVRPAMPTIDVAAIKERMRGHAMKPAALVQSQVRDSVIAWSWISSSLLERQTRPFPSQLSKTMQGWLQGLTYKQLNLLKEAGSTGVFHHASGKKPIPFVPPVQVLKAVTVIYPPPPRGGGSQRAASDQAEGLTRRDCCVAVSSACRYPTVADSCSIIAPCSVMNF
jgi:hypothetical protein